MGSETVMLLMGSSMLAYSFEKTGLDRRISLYAVSRIGVSLKKSDRSLVLVGSRSVAVHSENGGSRHLAANCRFYAAFCRRGRSVWHNGSSGGSFHSSTIVWGVSIGGTATPLGGSMNLVGIRYIEELLGREYLFAEWTMFFWPR